VTVILGKILPARRTRVNAGTGGGARESNCGREGGVEKERAQEVRRLRGLNMIPELAVKTSAAAPRKRWPGTGLDSRQLKQFLHAL
jgi:hypothetical protein